MNLQIHLGQHPPPAPDRDRRPQPRRPGPSRLRCRARRASSSAGVDAAVQAADSQVHIELPTSSDAAVQVIPPFSPKVVAAVQAVHVFPPTADASVQADLPPLQVPAVQARRHGASSTVNKLTEFQKANFDNPTIHIKGNN